MVFNQYLGGGDDEIEALSVLSHFPTLLFTGIAIGVIIGKSPSITTVFPSLGDPGRYLNAVRINSHVGQVHQGKSRPFST